MLSLAHSLRPHQWEPGLEAVARPPYILLPGFLFQLALCGHLVLVRRLRRPPKEPAPAALAQFPLF